jgi:hypothetical protein
MAVFFFRLDVGVVVQNGYLKMLGQPLQYGAGAGPAAAVQKQGGPAARQSLDFFFHFDLVIPFHEKSSTMMESEWVLYKLHAPPSKLLERCCSLCRLP